MRDLAFALAAPSLLRYWPESLYPTYLTCLAQGQPVILPDSAFWARHYQAYEPRLVQLDREPAPLQVALSQLKSSRLGLYFEALLAFWLRDRDYHDFELIAHSWQRQHQGQTLGEVDFIVLHHGTSELEQWELTLKFYLGENDLTQLEHWRGVNRRDHLQRKLSKMLLHQLTLARYADHAISCRRVIAKGRFFYPLHGNQQRPDWLTPDHPQGFWTTAPVSGFWQPAPRREWLAGYPETALMVPSKRFWYPGLYLGAQNTAPDAQHFEHLVLRRPISHLVRPNGYIHDCY